MKQLMQWIRCKFGKHETEMFSYSHRGNFACGMRCKHCGRNTEVYTATREELEEDGIMPGEKWH
jgi:uncharacterized radical SAM superfamily protein